MTGPTSFSIRLIDFRKLAVWVSGRLKFWNFKIKLVLTMRHSIETEFLAVVLMEPYWAPMSIFHSGGARELQRFAIPIPMQYIFKIRILWEISFWTTFDWSIVRYNRYFCLLSTLKWTYVSISVYYFKNGKFWCPRLHFCGK